MAIKTYKTYIDCRILSEDIKFIFLVSNVVGNTTSKAYNKKKCMTLTYNTNNLVEAICMGQGDEERLFLRFSGKRLHVQNHMNLFGLEATAISIIIIWNKSNYNSQENLFHHHN